MDAAAAAAAALSLCVSSIIREDSYLLPSTSVVSFPILPCILFCLFSVTTVIEANLFFRVPSEMLISDRKNANPTNTKYTYK